MDVEARRELAEILREARALLAREGNDFTFSRWRDADEAIGELEGLIVEVERGNLPDRACLTILFAPTGSIQEVSFSGWADEFIALSSRFDSAVERVYPG